VVEAVLKIARRKALGGQLPEGNLVKGLGIKLDRVPSHERAVARSVEEGTGAAARTDDGGLPGGIDLRNLPIFKQTVVTGVPAQSDLPAIRVADPDAELKSIEKLAACGLAPSAGRVRDLWSACVAAGKADLYKGRLLACIADILRQEEDFAKPTDPILRSVLILAEK
jgi:hypothetical protein